MYSDNFSLVASCPGIWREPKIELTSVETELWKPSQMTHLILFTLQFLVELIFLLSVISDKKKLS